MKTVNLLLAAAATAPYLALTACADGAPATLPEEPDDNAIRFTATAEYSRAGGDLTSNNLTSFNVYAYTGKGTAPGTVHEQCHRNQKRCQLMELLAGRVLARERGG